MRSKIAERILNNVPEETKIFTRWYGDLLVLIDQIMQEKGIKQKDLAEKMDKRPSEISKWLKGGHNFTLKSLAKLQAELGEELLNVNVKLKQEKNNTIPMWQHKAEVPRANKPIHVAFVNPKFNKNSDYGTKGLG
ncbi:XRE family transcriptional regulator [Lacihabitans sp. LS3-19]|uniref:helix-turn-helix domain-containing protein n=1 Tax=Lacihabitans sp. LS3-19 TaxID=2487335 RepID=UPI0020CFB5BB|nr:helix-turn-helix transcriptional regulator [Lacihabitans sp. LS3-19]MCP9769432.1 XRE family transcriptional regulator [Lacihabitans sp. LS3-19]